MNGYMNFGTGELRQKLTSAHVIILHSAEVSIGYWSPQVGPKLLMIDPPSLVEILTSTSFKTISFAEVYEVLKFVPKFMCQSSPVPN